MNTSLTSGLSTNLWDVILTYSQDLYTNPLKFLTLIIDIGLVVLLFTKLFKIVKDSRAGQLLRGILLIIVAMALSCN